MVGRPRLRCVCVISAMVCAGPYSSKKRELSIARDGRATCQQHGPRIAEADGFRPRRFDLRRELFRTLTKVPRCSVQNPARRSSSRRFETRDYRAQERQGITEVLRLKQQLRGSSGTSIEQVVVVGRDPTRLRQLLGKRTAPSVVLKSNVCSVFSSGYRAFP
jgi:hypothetical protein